MIHFIFLAAYDNRYFVELLYSLLKVTWKYGLFSCISYSLVCNKPCCPTWCVVFKLNLARNMRYVSVPTLTLPMDVIVGSKLQGSITGTVYGAPSLVSGKMNSALVLNGIDQKVVFGKYLGKCFHLPDMCDHESTFAYWLKWKPTTRGVIFDSGGYYLSSRGYFHGIQQNGKMTVYIKDATHYFDLNTPVGYIP